MTIDLRTQMYGLTERQKRYDDRPTDTDLTERQKRCDDDLRTQTYGLTERQKKEEGCNDRPTDTDARTDRKAKKV